MRWTEKQWQTFKQLLKSAATDDLLDAADQLDLEIENRKGAWEG